MKLVKSLLLGSAAGLAAVASAQAADLPFRKAAPVDYVRVCDWVGLAGYFYIPGTDTCIKIGGEMRAEYVYLDVSRSFAPTPFTTTTDPAGSFHGTYTPGKLRNSTGFFARGKIEVDSRTQTAYGLLRAFVRYQSDTRSGPYTNINYPGGGTGNESNITYIDKAYITFAGFTAGRVQSFFDLYADNWNFEDIANSDQSTQVLAYTATFGGGFSATISAEDPGVRRDGISTIAFGNTAVGPNAALAGPFVNGAQVGFQGQKLPDAVLQLAYTQAWGVLQLSAAYHDVNTVTTTSLVGTTNYASATEAGWAVQAGIDIKLPMLAAGDEFFLEGAYQEGAYLYQDSNANMSQILSGFQHQDVDAIAVGNGPGTNTYHLDLGKGFSVLGAFQHYFTPQFHDVLFGSYEEVSYGAAKNIDWTRGGLGDSSQYKIGNDFVFTPVHNLDFGLEVLYAKLNQTLAHEVGLAASPIPVGVKVNPDTFEVRLRVDRNF